MTSIISGAETGRRSSVLRNVFKWSMLAYLAILPMAETIALRNLLLFVLLVTGVAWVVAGRRYWGLYEAVPLPLLAWGGFMILFPIWAVQPEVALINLKGQWGLSIAAWFVGFTGVLLLGRDGLRLWDLVYASVFLVGVHLLLTLLAWIGLLGTLKTSDMPWSEIGGALLATLGGQTPGGWHTQPFPWGFRGFDPMHGNLGYTASQAIALLTASFFLVPRDSARGGTVKAAAGIAICFFSIVVANSRGAVLFSLGILFLAGLAYLLRIRQPAARRGRGPSMSSQVRLARWSVLGLCVALVIVLAQSFYKDSRWHSMFDKARAGFLLEDPVAFICEGLSPQARDRLRDRLGIQDEAYLAAVTSGLDGDGGRVVLMRVGLQLLMQQPFGLDGSRHSYKKIMEERCGHRPVFEFAHAHQAWIDTSLALGWAGALLYAFALGYFALAGWQALRDEQQRPWAFALFLMSVFWILRGFADSVYREHYLQMQALLLACLYMRMRLEGRGPA